MAARERGSTLEEKRDAYALRGHIRKCDKCGILAYNTEEDSWIGMVRNHKNGEWWNNDPSNVEILCPNCDSKDPHRCRVKTTKFRRPTYSRLRNLLVNYTQGRIAKACGGSSASSLAWTMMEYGLVEHNNMFGRLWSALYDDDTKEVEKTLRLIKKLKYQDEWDAHSIAEEVIRLFPHGIDVSLEGESNNGC